LLLLYVEVEGYIFYFCEPNHIIFLLSVAGVVVVVVVVVVVGKWKLLE